MYYWVYRCVYRSRKVPKIKMMPDCKSGSPEGEYHFFSHSKRQFVCRSQEETVWVCVIDHMKRCFQWCNMFGFNLNFIIAAFYLNCRQNPLFCTCLKYLTRVKIRLNMDNWFCWVFFVVFVSFATFIIKTSHRPISPKLFKYNLSNYLL